MTPELLAMLTPVEAKAWALCESCGPCADMGDDGTYAGEVRRCSDFALVHQDCDDDGTRKFIAEASVALPLALTTIATLRAELRAVADLIQEVGVLGIASTMDAVVVSGQPSARDLLTWAAKAMDAWPEERQALRAEVAELRATLDNERGEGTGPSEKWTWLDDAWRILDDVGGCTMSVHPFDNGRWHWRQHDPPYGRSKFPFTSARSAMRAADDAVRGAT